MSNKTNQILFELFTHNTIQNQLLHAVLIIVDYYPLLVSSLCSFPKIEKFGNTLDIISDKLKLFKNTFPYRIMTKGLDEMYVIALLAIILFFTDRKSVV